MPSTFQFRHRVLTLVAGASLLSACSSTPVTPTQVFAAPKAACPANVSVLSPLAIPIPVNYPAATATAGTPPTTISCTPGSGSTFSIGTTAVTCVATDSVKRTDTCAFNVTVTQPPKLAVTRFLAYGDSMTWGEDGNGPAAFARIGPDSTTSHPAARLLDAQQYPTVLQGELIARYTAQSPTVMNGGERGDTVLASPGQDTFHTRFVPAVTSGQYDVVLLMEGVNDLSGNDITKVNATVGGISVMIQTVKNSGLRVFLATIPPENPAGKLGGNAASVGNYNAGLRNLAAAANVPLVDVFQAFNNDLSLLGADGLHPNANGYKVIADTFFKAIVQNLELSLSIQGGRGPVLTPFSLRR